MPLFSAAPARKPTAEQHLVRKAVFRCQGLCLKELPCSVVFSYMKRQFPAREDRRPEQPIECEAIPVDGEPATMPPAKLRLSPTLLKWLAISFVLIFTLKSIGVLIVLGIIVQRFPVIMKTLGAAYPILRRRGRRGGSRRG